MERISIAAFAAALMACAQAAAPSDGELDAVRGRIGELVAGDIPSGKADAKSRTEAGDKFVSYLADIKDAPSRFLIMNAALTQYILADNADAAAALYDGAVYDHGLEFAVALAEVKTTHNHLKALANKNHPGVNDFKKRIDADVQRLKPVAALRKKIAKQPDDASLHEAVAVELVAIDGWNDEVEKEFSFAGGEFGALEGKSNFEKGEFWRKIADKHSKRKDVREALCIHAAISYQAAIDKNEVDGIEKTLAKKRVEEANEYKGAIEAAAKAAAQKLETLDPVKIEFNADTAVELIGCPAGNFMMGDSKDERKTSVKRYHRVIISRPFWMAKYKVTHKIWDKFRKYRLNKQDEAMGKWNRVHIAPRKDIDEFFVWLNQQAKFKKLVPKGYVFRLPTEAEWEYALNANATDPDDLYVRYKEGRLADSVEIICQIGDARERDPNNDFGNRIPGLEVGLKAPNRWGLYDMLGNGGEHTLDVIDTKKINGRELNNDPQTAIKYGDTEKDPLRWFDGVTKGCIIRSSWRGGCDFNASWQLTTQGDFIRDSNAFRIVLGPDLMTEYEFVKPAGKKNQKKK
ncbi:MAG: SUMF1/EgtB/PvdO family nonheme iron enzyme [Kiritimatiellae bacterium]|nr:SUMF1/EgtB/PvdO family nonheme iron enzyme [Kiritimatiellia bacterium]